MLKLERQNPLREQGLASLLPDIATVGIPPTAFGSHEFVAKSDIDKPVVIIEERAFLRQCIQFGFSARSNIQILSYSSVAEWLRAADHEDVSIVLLSVVLLSEQARERELSLLLSAKGSAPAAVLSDKDDLNLAIDILGRGAKGYIALSEGLDIVLEAIRFVSLGGTFLPTEWLLQAHTPNVQPRRRIAKEIFTSRELAVINAIRCAKSNKMIAYELGMCESTVKVHVRHVMKKLRARNRTEVALMTSDF